MSNIFNKFHGIAGTVLALCLAPSAHAVRTAVFPPEIHSRTAIWIDQQRIFSAETPAERARPIWVHSGDSLSTAWSNTTNLRAQLARAEHEALPEALSIADYVEHLPDASMTWYAGSKINFGVLGALDAIGPLPWVVLSSALAGAKVTINPPDGPMNEDSFAYMAQVDQPLRVKLVTFSLGTNDVCSSLDPSANEPALRARLQHLKSTLPNATIVPFNVVRITKVRKKIFDALDALPPSPGRDRLRTYCTNIWQKVCPNAATQADFIEQAATRLEKIYREYSNGILFDPLQVSEGLEALDFISADCFHPSPEAERQIVGPLSDYMRASFQ
ncbi:MAG: SGNH/GDSL hydrolase family protein [Bdellovibrionales bacterium]|nr:SGNH/GDSL hydrolase family protein [Bdellovibrionales bacterium]